MSSSRAVPGVKVGQVVVGAGQLGLGGDADRGLGGGMGGGVGGYGRDSGGYGLNWWEDTLANVILGEEPCSPCL